MTSATPTYDLTGQRIWVAGHRGMVGQALVRRLEGLQGLQGLVCGGVEFIDENGGGAWRPAPKATTS